MRISDWSSDVCSSDLEAKDMLRPVMAQIVAIVSAEQDAIRAEQTGGSNLAIFRPSRRAVGGDIAGFACPDDRHEDGGGDGKNTAGRDRKSTRLNSSH